MKVGAATSHTGVRFPFASSLRGSIAVPCFGEDGWSDLWMVVQRSGFPTVVGSRDLGLGLPSRRGPEAVPLSCLFVPWSSAVMCQSGRLKTHLFAHSCRVRVGDGGVRRITLPLRLCLSLARWRAAILVSLAPVAATQALPLWCSACVLPSCALCTPVSKFLSYQDTSHTGFGSFYLLFFF